MSKFQLLLYRLRVCMVRISVKTPLGTAVGAGFHIGEGWIITAKHVVDGGQIEEVLPEAFAYSGTVAVHEICPSKDPLVDLAALRTDFNLSHYMGDNYKVDLGEGRSLDKVDYIQIGDHLDDWMDDSMVLTKALLMGYPPIPFSKRPVLVAVEAEVNAIVDRTDNPHPHFIISALPRNGFSGGPVISEHGILLGVFTESLLRSGSPTELGYGAAISIQPLLVLMDDYKIHPNNGNGKLLDELD